MKRGIWMRRSVMTLAAVGLLVGVLAWLPGCGAAAGDGEDRMTIVTTTGMVRDIVQQVVGEHAEVEGLMGEGVDPHLYNPTRGDMVKLQRADVVFYSGLLLEGRMTDALSRLRERGQPIFAVTEEIDESYLLTPAEFEGNPDPHVWMDVAAWAECVDVVANRMAEVDPERADDYHSNAAAYRAELEALDAYVQEAIASIPEDQRVMVTAHDAFNYFGRAYDIEVRGVYGISTESEAGMQQINRLVDFVVERRIPAVFAETSVSEKAVRALIQGARSRGYEVPIGGELYSDAMGPSGTYEGTYVGMMDFNATTVARALGGEVPEGGMNGEL